MRARGFTLLEVLVAMAVLALLGVLAFRGLGAVLDAEARVQAETRRWGEVSLFLAQLGEDVGMAAGRTVRDPADRTSPALWLRNDAQRTSSGGDAQLELSRLGIGEGAIAQSAPRRVGYRLREGTLEYLVWPSPDAAPGLEPAAFTLLERVAGVRWQALDADGRWVDAWPAGQEAAALPRAIALRLELAGGEPLTRILALR